MNEEIDVLADNEIPAPIRASLAFLDYCRCRQHVVDAWGDVSGSERPLDLDEMRARQSALGALSRYFNSFEANLATDVLDEATAAIRAADAMRSQQPGG